MSLFNFGHRAVKLTLAGAALALTGGIVGAGCGGGYDTSTLDGFCQALAEADCTPNVVTQCYLASEAQLETDTNKCILARKQLSSCNPSSLPYHGDFAEGCLAAHAGVYALEEIDLETYKQIETACLPVFNMGKQKGAACKRVNECDVGAGLTCVVRVGGDGTCQIPVPTEAGQSCKDPAAQCGDGMYCDTGFHCVAIGGPESLCGPGQACGTGFRCNNQTHKCEPQLTDGDACKGDGDCVGGFCIGRTATNATGKCASKLIFAYGSLVCSPFEYH